MTQLFRKDTYILKRDNGNTLIFIHRDDVLKLEYNPKHKARRELLPTDSSDVIFSALAYSPLSPDYDVEKDLFAVKINESCVLYLKHQTMFLTEDEHENIKQWLLGEITRPIQEATDADVGKLCKFWDNDDDCIIIGKLTVIETLRGKMCYRLGDFACFDHCRRLTKQEIEELV